MCISQSTAKQYPAFSSFWRGGPSHHFRRSTSEVVMTISGKSPRNPSHFQNFPGKLIYPIHKFFIRALIR